MEIVKLAECFGMIGNYYKTAALEKKTAACKQQANRKDFHACSPLVLNQTLGLMKALQ